MTAVGISELVSGDRGRVARRLMIACLVAGSTLLPAHAFAQSTAQNVGDPSLDFFRPPTNLFQLLYGYRTAPGSSRDTTTEDLNLRYDHAFDIAPAWIVVTRTDLPLVAKNPLNASNPNGDYVYG